MKVDFPRTITHWWCFSHRFVLAGCLSPEAFSILNLSSVPTASDSFMGAGTEISEFSWIQGLWRIHYRSQGCSLNTFYFSSLCGHLVKVNFDPCESCDGLESEHANRNKSYRIFYHK
jgi:hypothetical protein